MEQEKEILESMQNVVGKNLPKRDDTPDKADWAEMAIQIAVQCWCDVDTTSKTMDIDLALAFAKRLSAWIETAAQNQRNADYYRGLLEKCGEIIGDRAYECDDGTKSQDVLCSKIPEIIANDYVNGEE